jgi:hypothetical protein
MERGVFGAAFCHPSGIGRLVPDHLCAAERPGRLPFAPVVE